MDEQRNWSVYLHTNLINGKMYVGITGIKPSDRWAKGYRHSTKFYHALQKYGWNNFEHTILVDQLTREEACEIEINLIHD